MAWLLETAGGKFIDNFATKGEAETARKNIGIVGCRVRSGKVPMTRLGYASRRRAGAFQERRCLRGLPRRRRPDDVHRP